MILQKNFTEDEYNAVISHLEKKHSVELPRGSDNYDKAIIALNKKCNSHIPIPRSNDRESLKVSFCAAERIN